MGAFLLLAVVLAVGVRPEASPEVPSPSPLPLPSPRFMDRLMSMNDCGRFSGLVNATANTTKTFEHNLGHGGLIFFCPDDKAVAAFESSFDDLCADGQLAVLLYHGVAPASLRGMRPTKVLVVPTLATDLANGGYRLTIRHRGDAMELLPSSSSGGVAKVTRMVADEEVPLVVYLIDAVLLPRWPTESGDSSFGEGPSLEEIEMHFYARARAVVLIFFAIVLTFIAVLGLIGVVVLLVYYVAFVVTARLSPTRVTPCSMEQGI